MRDGSVIRILSARAIVVDLGSNDGVTAGTRFGIYTAKDSVVHPQTGVRLGELEQLKATVIAESVYPTFSVARPPSVVTNPLTLGTERKPGQLSIDSGEAEPLPGSGPVRIGDPVRELLTPKS